MAENIKEDFIETKNQFKSAGLVLLAIIIIIISLFIFYSSVWLSKTYFATKEINKGTPVENPEDYKIITKYFLGIYSEELTIELIFLHTITIIMLFIVMYNITLIFSTRNHFLNFILCIALIMIASLVKMTSYLVDTLQIAGKLSIIGVILIIIGAIVSAFLVNIGAGKILRKWRMERQIAIESNKSKKGFDQIILGGKRMQRRGNY